MALTACAVRIPGNLHQGCLPSLAGGRARPGPSKYAPAYHPSALKPG